MKSLRILAAAILAGSTASASAQSSNYAPSSSVTVNPQAMAMIDPATGDVFIDWKEVERTSHGNGDSAKIPILVAAAKIMLAVKSGKWKPMPK